MVWPYSKAVDCILKLPLTTYHYQKRKKNCSFLAPNRDFSSNRKLSSSKVLFYVILCQVFPPLPLGKLVQRANRVTISYSTQEEIHKGPYNPYSFPGSGWVPLVQGMPEPQACLGVKADFSLPSLILPHAVQDPTASCCVACRAQITKQSPCWMLDIQEVPTVDKILVNQYEKDFQAIAVQTMFGHVVDLPPLLLNLLLMTYLVILDLLLG